MLRGICACACLLLLSAPLGAPAFAGEAAPAGERQSVDWRAEMDSVLKAQVSLSFNGSHPELLAVLQTLTDVPILLDGELQPGNGSVGFSMHQTTMTTLLPWAARIMGLGCSTRPGAVFISKQGGDEAWPKKAGHVEPATDEERKADELIRRALTGAPAELTPEKKAAVEKAIADFGSDDFATREAASTGAGALGREAIPLLRKAAESKDPEVAERAKTAIAAIEKSSALKDQLAKMPGAKKFIAACAAEAAWDWAEKAKAVIAAEKDPKADLRKLVDEAKAAGRRAAILGEVSRGPAKGG